MIKLSLNSPEASNQQAPFASALAAAVEAAGAQPVQTSVASKTTKKQPRQAQIPMPSNGLLTRGVRWLQHKGRSKKRMQMIETVSLGDKRFVALVKVDGREFLLGGAPTSVGMLADLGAHGLGDLLSLPMPTDTNVVVPAAIAPVAEKIVEPVLAAVPVAQIAAPIEVAEVKAVAPLAFELPEPVVAAATARINVVVEADENESDWLTANEVEVLPAPVMKAGPIVAREEPEQVANVIAEPAVTKAASHVEKLGPVAVPKPAALTVPVAAPAFPNVNFTFQMWPAAPVSGPVTAKAVVADIPTGKAKTGIDLESCPELLGEPYLLALVQNTRGAAA